MTKVMCACALVSLVGCFDMANDDLDTTNHNGEFDGEIYTCHGVDRRSAATCEVRPVETCEGDGQRCTWSYVLGGAAVNGLQSCVSFRAVEPCWVGGNVPRARS